MAFREKMHLVLYKTKFINDSYEVIIMCLK